MADREKVLGIQYTYIVLWANRDGRSDVSVLLFYTRSQTVPPNHFGVDGLLRKRHPRKLLLPCKL